MADPRNLQLRRLLMRTIVDTIEERRLKQREAAQLFGTTQPRISEIVHGKVNEFTIDSLVNMLTAAGVPTPPIEEALAAEPTTTMSDPVIEAYKKNVDRTQIREALRRTPSERVQALAELQSLAAEAAAAGQRRSARQ